MMRLTSRPAILALRVVEVGGHGDDGLRDLLAEVLLRRLLQALQHHRGDLLRGVDAVADLDAGHAAVALHDAVRHGLPLLADLAVLAAHEPLDREDRLLRVRDGLPLGRRADEALAVLLEGDDGGGRARALGVRDDGRLAAFHHRHDAVRRAEVDTDDLAHEACLRC